MRIWSDQEKSIHVDADRITHPEKNVPRTDRTCHRAVGKQFPLDLHKQYRTGRTIHRKTASAL